MTSSDSSNSGDRRVPASAEPTETRSADPRFRVALLGVLVVALLASAGCLVWLMADRRGGAGDAQAERDALMRQTEQFVLRLNTYGPDDLDAQKHLTSYRDRVTAVITAKFGADFEKSGLPLAEQTVAQAGYERGAKILGVGVETMDADSARTLVAASLTGSTADPAHPQDASKRIDVEPSVLRWSVDLVKVDGTWLVDDYAPVTEDAASGSASGSASDGSGQ